MSAAYLVIYELAQVFMITRFFFDICNIYAGTARF